MIFKENAVTNVFIDISTFFLSIKNFNILLQLYHIFFCDFMRDRRFRFIDYNFLIGE